MAKNPLTVFNPLPIALSLFLLFSLMFLAGCTMHTSQTMMPRGLFAQQTQNEQLPNIEEVAETREKIEKAGHLCEKMYVAFTYLKKEHNKYLNGEREAVTRIEVEALGFVTSVDGRRIENITVRTGEKVAFIEKLGNAMERKSPAEWAREISRWEDQAFACVDIQGEESFIYINQRDSEPRGWRDFYSIAYRADEILSLSSETSLPHPQESASAPGLGIIRGMSTLGDVAESAATTGATQGIKAGLF